MNWNIDFYEFINVFCNKLLNLFERIDMVGYIKYQFSFTLNKYRYFFYVDIIKREDSPLRLLEKWIGKFHNVFIDKAIILKYIYEKVLLSDLDLYIKIITILDRFHKVNNSTRVTLDLINSYKKNNLNLEEFMNVCYISNFIKPDVLFDNKMYIPYQEIQKAKTNKNNKIFDIWNDYDGEYKTLLEWLPRETLEDLINL